MEENTRWKDCGKMIEIGKEYRLANGWEYRLCMTDASSGYPVRGFYKRHDGHWAAIGHTADGKTDEHGFNLVEVRPRKTREVWVNIYPEKGRPVASVFGFATEELAHQIDGGHFLEARKLITIEYEVGEGL
jgi:hypothetical protein